MSVFCVTLGAMLLMGFILPTVKRLQCEFLGSGTDMGADVSSADECLEGQDTQLDRLDGDTETTCNAVHLTRSSVCLAD